MRNLKLGFAFLCLVLAFGCANQDFIEETQPEVVTLEGQRGTIQNDGDPVPVPVVDMTIAVEFPRGFDRDAFITQHGAYFGVTLVYQCPNNPARELWVVPYMTEEEFHFHLWEFFYSVNAVPGTQSNGNGGYQAHVKYESNNGGNQSSANTESNLNLISIFFAYNGVCD